MEIVEKVIEPMLIAGIRICGNYRESGRLFSTLGSKVGRHIAGLAFNLYYDCLLYTSPSPRDRQKSRMPSSA